MTTLTTGRATDFITFSRPGATGGGATVTDSDGKIKWAGHNLLLNSESFDNSYWVKLNATVTANSTASPSGATNADTLASSSSVSNTTGVYVNTTGLASGHTMSVFVKAGTSNIAWISGDNGQSYGVFSLSGSGSVLTSANGTASISAVGNSWFLITVANTTVSNAFFIIGGKDTYSSGHPWSNGTWTSGNTIFIWGAHLYRSDLGGMVLNPARGDAYYPTTPRNLLGFTEDFSNAAWVKTNILAFGSGSVSNAIVAPNGLQTADKIVSSTANNNHRVQWSVAGVLVSNTKYVFSFYAKAAEYTKVQIADAVYSVYSARFDLTGSGSVVASSGCTAAITSVGDGWYRCSAIYTSGGANAWAHISPYPDSGATFTVDGASYLGDGISGIYVWGAQLSDSASLDAYSPVYGAAVTSAAYYAPRLDYSGSSLAALGLLVEEQRTNLLTYSNQFEDASWGLAGGVTVVNNPSTITSPDGTSNADRVVPSTSPSAFNYIRRINITTANVAHTLSVYARASGYNFIELILGNDASYTKFATAYFNVSTGEFVTSRNTTYTVADKTITPVGGGWFRCTLTVVLDATVTTVATFTVGSTTNPTASFTGDGTSGVLFYGAQLEAGSFATSYIPVGATTSGATRTADVASVSTQAFPYSASEGTLVVSALKSSLTAGDSASATLFTSVNDVIEMYITSGDSRLYGATGGASFSLLDSNKIVAGSVFKSGVAFKQNDYALVTNGGAAQTNTTANVPVATTLGIGSRGGNVPFRGWIRQITYIPRRLSNAELQARTL